MLDRPCDACERYMYEDRAGSMGPLLRLDDGRPMPRPEGTGTPCFQCPKVPKDAPERTRAFAEEPTARSLMALRHYQRCQAVRQFPDDEIVHRNAELIGPVEREAEIARCRDAAAVLGLLMAGGNRG
jgi:hypothetical protein